jgi:hypothetical protein
VIGYGALEQFILAPVRISNNTVSMMLERSERISELATIRESYSTLVSSQTDMPAGVQQIWGTDVSLFATGQIVAGVDLSNLREQDITIEPGRVTIQLPSPRYLDCYLVENATATLSRRDGWFGATNPQIETDARRYALQRVIDISFTEGVLVKANEQAKDVLENVIMLSALDDDLDVILLDGEIPTQLEDTLLPQSCQPTF